MSIEKFLLNAEKRVKKQLEVAEIDIEDHFCKQALKLKCKAVKLVYLNKKGWPDRTVICPGGKIFFIEFKRKGKKPTPTQIAVRLMLESFGFEYHVCDKIGQAENILEDFLAFS